MNTMNPSTGLRGFTTKAILSALACSFVAVCAAADGSGTTSVIVRYGDLNISNPEGAATLYRRIVAAANNVCDPHAIDSRDLASRAEVNACVHKATADAVTKVGRPELVAIYNAKNRQPLPITVAATSSR
jgi:UrcA family protein